MIRLSFRELGGASLWYCEGVEYVLLGGGWGWGYCPTEKLCFLSFIRLDLYLRPFYFRRFMNTSLQFQLDACKCL